MDIRANPATFDRPASRPHHGATVGVASDAGGDDLRSTVGPSATQRPTRASHKGSDWRRCAWHIAPRAELAGALWVRGASVREYLASLATVPGLISLLSFLAFAAVPALVGELDACNDKSGRRSPPSSP